MPMGRRRGSCDDREEMGGACEKREEEGSCDDRRRGCL